MTTYRAAYWTSDDRQHEIALTGPEQSHLTDDRLIEAAYDEAEVVGLDLFIGEIEVGEWRERDVSGNPS